MTTHQVSSLSGENLFRAVSLALGHKSEQWEQSKPHRIPAECADGHVGQDAMRNFVVSKLGATVEFEEGSGFA